MKLPKDVVVIDDIISKELQETIKNTLLGQNFNWFFIPDITNVQSKQNRPGLRHLFVVEERINSDYHNLVLPIIENSCKKINFDYTKIVNGRSFLQFTVIT